MTPPFDIAAMIELCVMHNDRKTVESDPRQDGAYAGGTGQATEDHGEFCGSNGARRDDRDTTYGAAHFLCRAGAPW